MSLTLRSPRGNDVPRVKRYGVSWSFGSQESVWVREVRRRVQSGSSALHPYQIAIMSTTCRVSLFCESKGTMGLVGRIEYL